MELTLTDMKAQRKILRLTGKAFQIAGVLDTLPDACSPRRLLAERHQAIMWKLGETQAALLLKKPGICLYGFKSECGEEVKGSQCFDCYRERMPIL